MSYEADTELETIVDGPRPSPGPFGRLVDGLNGAGSAVIGAVMLLICADVLARNLLNRPIDGVAELVATSITLIVFLQLPATLRHGRMSRADLYIDPLVARSPRAGKRLRALFSLAGVLACGVMAYATWPVLQMSWQENEFWGVEGVFTFPSCPLWAIVLLGAALTALQYFLLSLEDFSKAAR